MKTPTARLTSLLAIFLWAPLASGQNSALVEFDAGPQGWSINGISTVTPTGGNPAERVRYPDPIDTFGIAVRNNSQAAFLGDYGAKGDVTLGLDLKVDYIQFFGSPVPRELVVILYDDDVQGPSGSSGVWTSLGVLQGSGMPWTSFSVDVTNPTSTTLPAGWGGIGDESPLAEPILPPGSTWASVLAGIDRVEFTTFVPGFFFGFTNFDVSADNISIQPLGGSAWTDEGCALAGISGDPLLVGTGTLAAGSVNGAELSNAAPSATAGLFLSLSSNPVPFKGGTLKPVPFLEPLFLTTSAAGTIDLPFVMPAGAPSGTELWVQWGIQDAAAVAGVSLSNAILGVTP